MQPDELSFDEGELLYIIDMSNSDWWKAKCGEVVGLIPSNYGKSFGCKIAIEVLWLYCEIQCKSKQTVLTFALD